ncbi:MAG TPA: MFS transporter [Blastocatellia bacterium]|nr:MFS transporter [Blastocatellia bacterium]
MSTRNQNRAYFALWVLFAINMMNFYDRQVLGAVGEAIRKSWTLSDTSLGLLGTAFTLLYAAVGLPLGRLTDRASRKKILSVGVFVWSIFTAGSGLSRTYNQLFAARLGVGVGEASCAPAAASLIGDLFPASKRAKALAIFMLGLPLGIAASNAISGWAVARWDWQHAFYAATVPGLLCAGLALFITEPKRGASEVHDIGGHKRKGSSFGLVLSIPTMWWIIASGALHNFNMYAIGGFLIPFLIRFHGMQNQGAGLVSMAVYGLSGIPGLLIGGYLGDSIMHRRANGRLLVGAIAIAISVPLNFLALTQAAGHIFVFSLLAGCGIGVMYAYYSTVYSTIQDVIEPSLRGTAMALYFFAMYVLGASLGPLLTGVVSDHYTKKAALAAGVTGFTDPGLSTKQVAALLEPFKGQGLHSAMYLVPFLGALLTVVLFAASATVAKDREKLHRWMSETAAKKAAASAATAD